MTGVTFIAVTFEGIFWVRRIAGLTFILGYRGLKGEDGFLSFERIVIILGGRICHLHGERDAVIERFEYAVTHTTSRRRRSAF